MRHWRPKHFLCSFLTAMLLSASCPPVPAQASCPAPQFAPPRAFDAGRITDGIVVGDFNGDGRQDVVFANTVGSSSQGQVLLGDGAGNLQAVANPFVAAEGLVRDITVGDFNEDGRLDVAAADSGSGSDNVDVILGNGDGSFQAARIFQT